MPIENVLEPSAKPRDSKCFTCAHVGESSWLCPWIQWRGVTDVMRPQVIRALIIEESEVKKERFRELLYIRECDAKIWEEANKYPMSLSHNFSQFGEPWMYEVIDCKHYKMSTVEKKIRQTKTQKKFRDNIKQHRKEYQRESNNTWGKRTTGTSSRKRV